jgi:tRNA nucleotidyltransferase (CCA-adding enzyme)
LHIFFLSDKINLLSKTKRKKEMVIKLPENVEKLILLAEQSGEKAVIVGGCVRDSLLGKEPTDWDIAISCLPLKTKEIYKDYKTVDTGIKYGTVSVLTDDGIYEITTFRSETEYGDLRHPKEVVFEKNINEDLKRRDFTVNALAYNPKEGMVDLFNGTEDLKNKTIRAVGNADERFKEDALRILRAIRFESTLGFSCDEETKRGIFENATLLEGISKERIKQEMDKMFSKGRNVEKTLLKYEEIFKTAIKSIKSLKEAKGIDNFEGEAKWAKLLLDEDIEEVAKELKFSNKLKAYCHLIQKNIKKGQCQSLVDARRFVKETGEENAKKIIAFKKQMGEKVEKDEAFLKEIKEKRLCCSIKELAINGNDLIEMGIKKEEIKKELERRLDLVIEEKCENIKEELKKW